jgi:uncharacterized protein
MHLNEIDYGNARPIKGYGPGFFRIAGEVYQGALLVTADETESWGGFDDITTLLTFAGQVDVLFIGTGPLMGPIPKAFRDSLEEAGIGIEPMATDAACRTFNVLLSEGRRVAAALLPM